MIAAAREMIYVVRRVAEIRLYTKPQHSLRQYCILAAVVDPVNPLKLLFEGDKHDCR